MLCLTQSLSGPMGPCDSEVDYSPTLFASWPPIRLGGRAKRKQFTYGPSWILSVLRMDFGDPFWTSGDLSWLQLGASWGHVEPQEKHSGAFLGPS